MRQIDRLACLLVLSLLSGWVNADQAMAQQRVVTAQQYIESTSPLKTGGTVTSRTTPGGRMETITRIAQLPVREGNVSSVLNSPLSPQSVYRVPQTTATPSGQSATGTAYPYPATQPPRLRYTTGQGMYAGSRSLATAPGAGTMTTPYVAYQATNTLGLPPVNRVARSNCASCDTATTPPPNLTFNVPGQAPAGGVLQTYPVGATGYPNGAYGARQSWWTPFVTGSGTYPPLLFRRNLPPGTYLGQGIVGQPTAYVDGQPIRNLLRYVFP